MAGGLGYVPIPPEEGVSYGSRAKLYQFSHSTQSQLLLPFYAARRNLYLYNASATATAFITFDLVSSITACTFPLPPGIVYEFGSIIYLGPISSISDGSSGFLYVTGVSA
jgi:hypothetical protein